VLKYILYSLRLLSVSGVLSVYVDGVSHAKVGGDVVVISVIVSEIIGVVFALSVLHPGIMIARIVHNNNEGTARVRVLLCISDPLFGMSIK